jgi:hypothetical protein
MALGERLEGSQAKWRLHLHSCLVGASALAQGSHELVDLAERLAGNFFDRLERDLRALRVLLAQQPGGAGLDEDHVDRVPGRVVEVARDARTFLGRGQAPFALGIPLGTAGSLLELCSAHAAQTDSLADNPRPAPQESP